MDYQLTTIDTLSPIIGYQPYDESMKDAFTFTLYADPIRKLEAIKVIPTTGPPRREFGTQMAMNTLLEGDNKKRLNQTIALPASSLSRLDWHFDPSRWSKAILRKLAWSEDGAKVVQSKWPIPITVFYQFDMWTKHISQMNQFLRLLLLKFIDREVSLKVDVGGPLGILNIPVFLANGPRDITGLDPGSEERNVRFVADLKINAWIVPDSYMIPTVKKLVGELYVGNLASPYPDSPDFDSSWIKDRTVVYPYVSNSIDDNP